MAHSFDCFFKRYKRQLREAKNSKRNILAKFHNWTALIVFCIAVVSCLVLLFWRMDDSLCVYIAVSLLICSTILFANADPYSAIGPDEQPYLAHITQVKELLKDYGINATDSDRIKTLIDYAKTMMTRRDPLADVKRAFVITGSAMAVIAAFLSGALRGTIDFVDSIPYVVVILILIFGGVLFFSPVSEFLAQLLFQDKAKYQKLIDDLNHILMFDVSTAKEKSLAENENISVSEEKQVPANIEPKLILAQEEKRR